MPLLEYVSNFSHQGHKTSLGKIEEGKTVRINKIYLNNPFCAGWMRQEFYDNGVLVPKEIETSERGFSALEDFAKKNDYYILFKTPTIRIGKQGGAIAYIIYQEDKDGT